MAIQYLHVFFSYSRKDNQDHPDDPNRHKFVRRLVDRVGSRCHMWWDQRLAPAEVWWTTILEQIEKCDCFALLLTPAYTASVFCMAELEYAVALNKPLLPIVPDTAVRFPVGVAHAQAAMIDGYQVGEAYGEIMAGLGGLRPDQYPPPSRPVKRPPEPTPTGGDQLSDMYAEAAEAEEANNTTLALHFYDKVSAADPGHLGDLARKRAAALRRALKCRADYENIIRLAARPNTLSHAIDLWEVYREGCGTDHDPKGFARDPRFARIVTPPPPPARTRPRSVDLLPAPFAWIKIPAGKVALKTEKGWADNYIPEGKTQTFDVPAFQVAKYPLTNAQFALFIEAGGYTQDRWWTKAGMEARQQGIAWDGSAWKPTGKPWTEPRYWRDEKWNKADYPVVGVSWYEAVAYCLWLSDVTGDNISLPTEQQWQRAAQGNDGRAYPWGNDWDCKKCNNSVKPCDSNETTPVTMYEGKGDSPFNVVDMAGNVWEWCLTAYQSGSTSLDGTDVRVLRGGSWNHDNSVVFRCGYRFRDTPAYWGSLRGVRLALS